MGRRIGVTGTLLLAAVALSACNDTGRDKPDDRARDAVVAETEATIHSLFQATNDRDADRVLGHYLPTAELVNIACTTIREGFAERERILRMWHEDRPEGDIEYEIVRTQTVGTNGAVVTARGRSHEGTALFWTFVLRNEPGHGWRVIQEHQSWPGCREVRIHPGG
jgi:ketosteroid isomerase-like protein